MSRRIVFAGGAQTRALARIYRGEIAAQAGDDVVFIGTGAVGTDAARSTLMLADIVAMEVDEDGDAIPAAALPDQASVVRIPNLYCDFLWPFAGRAHPRNRGAFALPGGPYPAEHGDRFLDQMSAEGVDEDQAIARYLAMDIAREGELDSRLTDRLAILQQLDAAAGYDLAGFIADRFRTEPLFRTRQRMTITLLRRLTAQFFEKLGVQGWQAESLRRVPFAAGAQPLHPGVIAHFGLTWVAPAQTYPVNEEGFFTFDAFARRYMRFTWNEALHRGIQTAKTDPAAALADLEQGLTESPDSPLGQLAFAAARLAAGLDHGSLDSDAAAIIDEDSYDPVAEAGRLDQRNPADVPAGGGMPGALPAHEPEADMLDAVARAMDTPDAPASEAHLSEPAFSEPPSETPVDHARADEAPPDVALAGAEADPSLAYGSTAEEELIAQAAPDLDAATAGVEPAVSTLPEAPVATHDPLGDVTHEASHKAPPEPAPNQAPDHLGYAPPLKTALIEPAPAPAKPPSGGKPAAETRGTPSPGSIADGFTDFRPAAQHVPEAALAPPGSHLIEVLPRMLPVFADMASAVDRPFGSMPEVMPPPPLRPILPPELLDEPPRPGLLARMLGRR